MKSNSYEYLFLETQDLYLRPFQEADEAYFARWCNEPENRGKTGLTRPITPDAQYQALHKSSSDSIWFAIVRKSDRQVIGETGLLRMFPDWGCTDVSIMIYDPSYQHQGYGRQALLALMNYAFGDLHMHRLAIGVAGFNHAALTFYKSIGFKQEGIQEEGYYYHYQYHDFIMMRILKGEFIASQTKKRAF